MPQFELFDLRLQHVDSGDPGVRRMATVMDQLAPGSVDLAAMMADPQHPGWSNAIVMYKRMRDIEQAPLNEKSLILQHKELVQNTLGTVVNHLVNALKKKGTKEEKSFRGDMARRINSKKASKCGCLANSIESHQSHYRYLRELDQQILSRNIPSWLL